MKRILRLLIVILLLLTGCSSQPTTSVDSKDHLNMIKPPETIQSEEAAEEETMDPISFFQPVNLLEAEASSEATEPSETLDVEHHRQDANTELTEPQSRESPQESVPGVSEEATSFTEPVPTIPKEPEPSVTEPVVIPTAPTDPPKEETQPTEPEPDPEPVFDIEYWIGYAKSYARSVGLKLDGTATECWDNPITAGPHSTCLERDIQSRLNRYGKDEEITDVWIWAVPLGNGSYDLYIGYA